MPVYDMKCPRCGKQSTEYDENKWQCLHCGNRFVYKEESPTYQSQTNVNIQGSSLFDVEPYDPGNERAYKESHSQRTPLEDDPELKKLKNKRGWAIGCGGLFFLGFLPGVVVSVVEGLDDGLPVILVYGVLTGVCLIYARAAHSRIKKRVGDFIRIKGVGWITLCPTCKEEHSRYRHSEKNPTSGPVHCASCGKQFMLLKGKAHVIKR